MKDYDSSLKFCQALPSFEQAMRLFVRREKRRHCDLCGQVKKSVRLVDYEDCMGSSCMMLCETCLKEGGEKYA